MCMVCVSEYVQVCVHAYESVHMCLFVSVSLFMCVCVCVCVCTLQTTGVNCSVRSDLPQLKDRQRDVWPLHPEDMLKTDLLVSE